VYNFPIPRPSDDGIVSKQEYGFSFQIQSGAKADFDIEVVSNNHGKTSGKVKSE
jgi:hypothetical protein